MLDLSYFVKKELQKEVGSQDQELVARLDPNPDIFKKRKPVQLIQFYFKIVLDLSYFVKKELQKEGGSQDRELFARLDPDPDIVEEITSKNEAILS